MTTYKLTKKEPDQFGVKSSYLGWHFTLATAYDALEGATIVQGYGWEYNDFRQPRKQE